MVGVVDVVVAAVDILDAVVVADDAPLVSPLVPQDLRQQVLVRAGRGPVNTVIYDTIKPYKVLSICNV